MDAAVSNDAVFNLTLFAVVAGNTVTNLGVYRMAAIEEAVTDFLIDQRQRIAEILFHRPRTRSRSMW